MVVHKNFTERPGHERDGGGTARAALRADPTRPRRGPARIGLVHALFDQSAIVL